MLGTRSRLALYFTGITGLLLALFCGSLYLWVADYWERDLERRLDTQRRALHERFLEEYEESVRGVHADLAKALEGFLSVTGDVAEVRRADGTVLYRSDGFDPGAASGRFEASVAGKPYRGVRDRLVVSPGKDEFDVSFAVAEEHARRHLADVRLYFAIFGPLVLLIAWMLGRLFIGKALAPVEELRGRAERISRENLSERVPVPRVAGDFRNLARTFNEMLDRLDRAFEDLRTFAADAAHELRTPLATLRAEIETTIQDTHHPEEYEKVLGSMAEEISRMQRIIMDLFTLAQLDLRQYALNRERVALLPLLREAREAWQTAAAQRGIRITMQGADAEVLGDPVALRRVFMNLVENAVKYNRDSGEIRLAIGCINGRIRVAVSDTGVGIPPEHLTKLFRRFYRVDKGRSRQVGGAGLGLAICKAFVEAHEGSIRVESAPSRGTTFTIELPASPAA